MRYCCGCDKKIKFYHKIGGNSSWHKQCWDSWRKGYDTATTFGNDMSARFKLPTSDEIYWATQMVPDIKCLDMVLKKIVNSCKFYNLQITNNN